MRFLADENLRNGIISGLIRRYPDLDIVRVQDVGLSNTPDDDILAWAAEAGRILLTHDQRTMDSPAWGRVEAEEPMPGVFIIPSRMPTGSVLEDLSLVIECSPPDEWRGLVTHLPL
jgi:hypothetical protein